ncbi:RNA polymerase sigma factor (sigma-70 family) [Paraburkholderia bannensis]|uniref:RNA polymerase sigma factor (Sigma-70 family) n=1 Tax=Paraburkholderia bannensis TaxID=765414 RepID=A0A7W9U0J9_9BURK|nr:MULTISPECIES: sigma-70 family RNA polymerase sigma factor [Paraburkholderia]MBB3259853.1 RNA polymerase sigma factor (sigma-70 family) [Paraburkholderia sp. WP4_3_2]MBB6104837.1 RNA polymerase sigma factor (sigma-70 family) [Paraburkholderia bannensis]
MAQDAAPGTAQDGGKVAAVHRSIEAVWRIERARVIAYAARVLRDVGLAEDAAQDALVAALESWSASGIPANPGAWLMTAARHRALDRLRRAAAHARAHRAIGADLEALEAHFAPDIADALDAARENEIGDDLLRLMFVACHPVLPREQRVALTLRLLGGLSTPEIARAFLVAEATVAQRIVRARRALAAAKVPFEVPDAKARAGRLASVLEVIYLIFNEGYAATSGADWMRPALCEEALRLGRMLEGLAPAEAEVHGLAALMELQASRLPARVDRAGRAVLLADQDRARWDRLLIRRGFAALERAQQCASAASGVPGPYALQAALAACHAGAPSAAQTDWARIVGLYDALLRLDPSPVVRLNRAVAVGMAQGPQAALALIEALEAEPALRQYPWLPAVRGDLLAKLGRPDEARAAFESAAALTQNARDREVLLARAASLAPGSPPEQVLRK